jgi:outer membrane protein OmpA-like peptidoglycan-associated protein
MNKIARLFIILTAIALVCPSLGLADIVYIKNEDKLVGTLQNPAFSVQTPYGKIRIETEFLKSLSFKEGSTGRWIVETINNDRFSGRLLNDSIQFLQDDGRKRNIDRDKIRRIWREHSGPSHRATTTIITMQNDDRFSGRFLSGPLEIRANFITRTIQPNDINRLEFSQKYQGDTEILLETGDLITGVLKQNQFRLAPDSISELTVARASVKCIQFNAPKMILRAFNGSAPAEADRDGDGDGIPDYADMCMDTPAGAKVGMDGCPKRSQIERAATGQKINGYRKDPENSPATNSGQLPKILFDFDRAELKPRYFSALDEAAVTLKSRPLVRAEIHGHTDNVGTEDYNQNLSMRRARRVEQYLVQKGVDRDRLFSRGFGFKMNAASNESEVGRALNRRVEILLVPDQERLAFKR